MYVINKPETWILSQKLEDYINSYATNCYRVILGIRHQERVSNFSIYQIINQQPLSTIIQQRQLTWLRHILREPSNELMNIYALYDPQHGRRKQGRQRVLYHQYIANLINRTISLSPVEIRNAAQDRSHWRQLVTDCFAADR